MQSLFILIFIFFVKRQGFGLRGGVLLGGLAADRWKTEIIFEKKLIIVEIIYKFEGMGVSCNALNF